VDAPPSEARDDPTEEAPTEDTPEVKYARLQAAGARIRRWIADPNEPDCKIPRSTLTFDDLGLDPESVKPETIPRTFEEPIQEVGLPNEWDLTIAPGESVYRSIHVNTADLLLRAWSGPGMLLLHTIGRVSGPPVSQVAQAFYERDFPVSGLRYVFMGSVTNEETLLLLEQTLYTEANNLKWPNWSGALPEYTPVSWEYGTPQYDALLGTRIGKTVAYAILGAFPRGTRRIERIVTWPSATLQCHMRFDIDVVEGAAGEGDVLEEAPAQDVPAEEAHDEVPTVKYVKFQEAGAQRRRWIADPEEPDCTIPRSTLTFADLDLGRDPVMKNKTIHKAFEQPVRDLGLPNEWDTPVVRGMSVYRYIDIANGVVGFKGWSGPGLIALDTVSRSQGQGPPVSQIAQAVYEKYFAVSELRYVFVKSVINEETIEFVEDTLYPANDLKWSTGPAWQYSWQYIPRTWAYGTPEYDALLGTRIGKLVAYIVLGAFPRGTRRIERIVTWPGVDLSCHMRFDIESTPTVT
jgi:hypothetical protein